MPETVVLLHGFAGTRRAWDGVAARLDAKRYRPLALDLPGHGALAAVRPISFASCVEHVLASAPARFALCGYSLGGRVALHVALAASERVTRLALVSSSAGIEHEAERAARRRADATLAAELESLPFGQFISRWRAQPLFACDPPGVDALARADHLRNDPRALAAVLRGVGAGEMQPLWDRLGGLAMPALVVAGERDEKYRLLAQRMVALLPRGESVVIPGGHALALESPAVLARALERPDP
ncbi:MAG TPA: alpha/beta fold hydrolase [Solirubrobacteraceae bacterium]|nr:alpha/beta fold hydrolase [Solirubrobacteraceae bacterium]